MHAGTIGSRQLAMAAALAALLEFLLLLLIAASLLAARQLDRTDDETAPPQPEQVKPPEPEAVEETVVLTPLPVPAKPKEILAFQLVDNSAASEARPDRPTQMISDRASRAASEVSRQDPSLPALPTVEGIREPGLDLLDSAFQDGPAEEAGDGRPPAAAAATATPAPQPESAAAEPPRQARETHVEAQKESRPTEATLLELPDSLPRLEVPRTAEKLPDRLEQTDATQPADQSARLPDRPSEAPAGTGESGFRSAKIRRALEGTLSQRGKASLDVEDTPLGRYLAKVSKVVERDWQHACSRHRDMITPGFLRVRFVVAADGRVLSARPIETRDGAAAATSFTLNAVRRAKLPPIPGEVLPLLENEQLEIHFNFLFFQ